MSKSFHVQHLDGQRLPKAWSPRVFNRILAHLMKVADNRTKSKAVVDLRTCHSADHAREVLGRAFVEKLAVGKTRFKVRHGGRGRATANIMLHEAETICVNSCGHVCYCEPLEDERAVVVHVGPCVKPQVNGTHRNGYTVGSN